MSASIAHAQLPELRQGSAVPHEVRQMYQRGLRYLAANQSDQGDWQQLGVGRWRRRAA